MSKARDHFCPGCGKSLPHEPRYPWYFCSDCLAQAKDAAGRSLGFGNTSFSGGLVWWYVDAPALRDDRALWVECLIHDRPVVVHEARFGGVVAEPVNPVASPTGAQGSSAQLGSRVRLTADAWLAPMAKRLKEI